MKALILIQDELVSKVSGGDIEGAEQDSEFPPQSRKPEDRMIVLCIAYHNIAVEQEFLKQYQASLNSYAKAAQSASKYLGEPHPMTQNMNEVLTQATKKIAAIIQKTMVRGQMQQSRVGIPMQELESLIRQSDLE